MLHMVSNHTISLWFIWMEVFGERLGFQFLVQIAKQKGTNNFLLMEFMDGFCLINMWI